MELIKQENGALALGAEISLKIANLEKAYKDIKEQEEALKKQVLEAMEDNNIKKLDNELLTITYIEPTDRETFDSKTFKADNPDLYDAYVRMSTTKSSIRIKVK